MNPFLVRNVFFPFYHAIARTGVLKHMRELRTNQLLSSSRLEEYQRNKLSRLLHHAWSNVPFYRHRFESAGIHESDLNSADVLSNIPLLTKKEINENRENMLAINNAGRKLMKNSTSGSTGEALYFFTDLDSWAVRRAVVIRNEELIHVRLGERKATLWGAAIDINKNKNIRGHLHRLVNNYIMLSSYDLSGDTLREYVSQLNGYCPVLLTTYPGPGYDLATYMLDNDLSVASIRAVITSAETLYPWQRELMEKAFACPVYNRYGCREFGDIAHECTRREGLHVNADRVVLEVLDENLQACNPCQSGDIVITDLDNYGMPFIRYRIGDRGSYLDKPCSCGLGFPLLEGVEGRTLDVVRAGNGKSIGGTFWTLLFRSKPGFRSFQVVQDDKSGIKVYYEKDCMVKELPLNFFAAKIRETCGENFRIIFQEVDEIERTSSGKMRFVVLKLNEHDHE